MDLLQIIEDQKRAETAAQKILSESIFGEGSHDDTADKALRALDAITDGEISKVYQAHLKAVRMGARCQECSLYGCRQGPVLGDIVENAKLTIVGEAPGKNEVEQAKVFVGASGRELDESLQLGELERSDCTITNVLLCRPKEDLSTYLLRHQRANKRAIAQAKKDERPTPPLPPSPIECCAPRLLNDIEHSNSTTLLAVGGRGLHALANYFKIPYGKGKDVIGDIKAATIMNQHGAPITLPEGHELWNGGKLANERILCSSLHPAFAMRGSRQYKYVIREDIARAARIVSRGDKIDWHEPNFHIFPSPEVITRVCRLFVDNRHRCLVTVDIETDSKYPETCRVRCVGLGAVIDGEEHVIVVPFRQMDGREYWGSIEDKRTAYYAVREVLDECELVMHNGLFDTNVCLRVGLLTKPKKTWFDTMLADHDTDANDLPHDLGAVIRRYLEAPMHKQDVDHKVAGNVQKDKDLHTYCARDILGTQRLEPLLKDRIIRCATGEQFSVDTDIAPTARDMGRLGLVVNEFTRGRLSKRFNKLANQFRGDFQQLVAQSVDSKGNVCSDLAGINPGSWQQVGRWLFDRLSYEPTLNPKGYEWDGDDESRSTSSPALIRLQENGVDSTTDKAIDALFDFRACETLRGRYVDGLPLRYLDEFSTLPKVEAVEIGGETILPERDLLSLLNPTFKIHVVPTGRWSSAPNVQNWPSRAFGLPKKDKQGNPVLDSEGEQVIIPTNMRRMVVAPPGHVIVGADYKQIELRLYALQADDRLVLKAFREGLDPHTLNAATLFVESANPTEAEIMAKYFEIAAMPSGLKKYYRTIAKRFVYLETYGGEEEKLFQVMSSERDKATMRRVFPKLQPKECAIWHERWHQLHPETKIWQDRCQRMQREYGWVATLLDHRKRYFLGGPNKKNAVANHTIQGSAAAITSRAILRIAAEIPFGKWSRWTGLCLQVHDYIGVYVPESRADEAAAIIAKCMFWEHEGMDFPADKPEATWDWAAQG